MFAGSVSSGVVILVVAVFLASCVEMVEALTIVLAVGHTRGWRSALEGSAVALVTLAVLVVVFGPAIVRVPTGTLHLVIGAILLIFGMQWLRKAILRSSGLKAMHDEDAIYQKLVSELKAAGTPVKRDRLAFVVAFKGVFLEGLEVVILVITLGTSDHRVLLASMSALVAVVMVGVVGVIVAKQLSKVPENAMKMSVGVLLVSYGSFWTGEGLKVHWPGSDAMLLVFAVLYAAVTWLLVAMIRRNETALAVRLAP